MVNKITIVHFFTIVILFTILAIDKISGYRDQEKVEYFIDKISGQGERERGKKVDTKKALPYI